MTLLLVVVVQEDFSPNEEDMIMTRVRTTGIVVSGGH